MDHYRDLEGKTALVTGSGRNIGRAVLLELAAKGADVIVNARTNKDEAESVATEARAYGVRAMVGIGDVSQQETVDRLADLAEAEFGGVDVVVSSAAVRPVQSFFELPVEDWQTILNTQLTASFRLAKAFVPSMVEKRWGRIIHITGPDAFIGLPHRAHNVTAKGGLRALTKALAIELGPFGITVNDVAPGNIRSLKDDASHPVIGSVPAPDRQAGVADIPVGRQGEPEDVAYACGFLASPRAGFYTGTAMHCFGGQWNLG